MPIPRKYAKPKDPRKVDPVKRRALRRKVLALYDTCAICGKPVDKTLPAGHPLAPELDEIIPVSRGGSPTDLDNLQLTHRICNERKGAKMPGDYEGVSAKANPIPISKAW